MGSVPSGAEGVAEKGETGGNSREAYLGGINRRVETHPCQRVDSATLCVGAKAPAHRTSGVFPQPAGSAALERCLALSRLSVTRPASRSWYPEV